MRRRLWNACKFIIPIIILIYIILMVRSAIENFWNMVLLNHFQILGQVKVPILHFGVSLILTFISLVLIGYILELETTRRLLDYIAKHLPVLRYFWSVEDDSISYQRLTPVLFQHPMPGEWKVGFIMGEQKMDNGKEFYRIYFITGVGDHEFIEKGRTDLIIPLANSPPEIMQFIASFMASGPKVLRSKI